MEMILALKFLKYVIYVDISAHGRVMQEHRHQKSFSHQTMGSAAL